MKKMSLKRREDPLWNSPDPVLRRVHRGRTYIGWLLVLVTLLFVGMNLQLFTPASIGNIRSSLKAASVRSAEDMTVISYPSGSSKSILPFGNGLAVCSDNMLSFEMPGKYSQMETNLSYANPVMRASNQYLLIFDRGAYRFTVTNTLNELYSQTMSSPITNADIAANGNVAIVTDEAGYKSAVRVYNVDNEHLYTWSTNDYYIMSAALSSDGQRLALFCFRQDGLTLTSKLFFADISSDKKPNEGNDGIDMNGSLVLGMKFLGNNTVCTVCDSATYVVSRGGQIKYQKDYSSDDLIAFDLTNDCLALATEAYSQTGRAEVVLINARGTASRKPLYLPEQPDGVSYCDGRLAVTTGETVTFYSKSLKEIDSQTGLTGLSRVYMRSGGSAIALFNSQARVLTIGSPLKDLHASSD